MAICGFRPRSQLRGSDGFSPSSEGQRPILSVSRAVFVSGPDSPPMGFGPARNAYCARGRATRQPVPADSYAPRHIWTEPRASSSGQGGGADSSFSQFTMGRDAVDPGAVAWRHRHMSGWKPFSGSDARKIFTPTASGAERRRRRRGHLRNPG